MAWLKLTQLKKASAAFLSYQACKVYYVRYLLKMTWRKPENKSFTNPIGTSYRLCLHFFVVDSWDKPSHSPSYATPKRCQELSYCSLTHDTSCHHFFYLQGSGCSGLHRPKRTFFRIPGGVTRSISTRDCHQSMRGFGHAMKHDAYFKCKARLSSDEYDIADSIAPFIRDGMILMGL